MRFPRMTTRRLMVVVALLVSEIPGPTALAQASDVEQERAVAAIEKLGGKVERDRTSPGHPVLGVDLRMTDATDKDLASLEGLKSLQNLRLSSNRITDAGLVHIKRLTDLR